MLFSDGVFAQSVITSERDIVRTDAGKMAYVQEIENSMQRFKYKQTAYDVKRTRLTDENGKLYEDIVQSYIGNHLTSSIISSCGQS